MPNATYGGQAVIEGVMIRGTRAMAVAVRRADGSITSTSRPLGGLSTGALRRVPLLRGVLVLWETLALGMRALSWSAAVAADEVDAQGEARPLGAGAWLGIALSMLFGVALFFLVPVLTTAWLQRWLPGYVVVTIEGLLRLMLLVGYIWAISRSQDIQRVFQYHGAEHMTIHAYEQDRELTVQAIRRFAKEHPRCGTSFLLTVGVVAIFVFALLGNPPLWWRLTSRVVLVPLIAAVAYEAIRFAGFHQDQPLVRALFAVASLRRAIAEDLKAEEAARQPEATS
jgi:uncharacterized protein YqhQ